MPKNSEESLDDLSSDINIVSFVVRVWREDTADEDDKTVWRGHITPLPDGTRHYFTSFDEIPAFMQDFLKSIKSS
jgi:hypothetical protein